MKKYQGAIFDLDGTLLDSMGVWKEVDAAFLKKRGWEVPPDYQEAITPMGFQKAAEYTIERFGFPETPEELIAEWYDLALTAYTENVQLKDGAKEYLESLKKRGIPMAVATSSDPRLFQPALKRNGIDSFFQAFVTVRDVARGKGFPDIYERAAHLISCRPEECVVFEDILAGLHGARMGGFASVAVFDVHSVQAEEKLMEASDRFIHSFWEFLADPEHDFF